MAGNYCYYPTSTPPPAMRGYGQWLELIGVLAQVGATTYQAQQAHIAAIQAQHQAARDAEAARQQYAAQQQQAAQQAAQQAQGAMTGGAAGVAAQLQAVPKWVWGAGAAGVAALFFLRRRAA